MNPKIAVLASGSGTTAESFIRAKERGDIKSQVALVIVSRANAGVIEKIENLNHEFSLNIECKLINHNTHPAKYGETVSKGFQTKAEEMAILEVLKAGNFDLVALMGYMKRIGLKLVNEYGWLPEYSSIYEGSMLNTHPGILPDTKAMYGSQIQQYVLDHHLPHAGQTLHLVSGEYDDGPIITEHRVGVEPNDTVDSLFARVQATEKQYLPSDIEAFIESKLAYTKK